MFYFRYFFYHKKYESAKSKILDFFFPVDRILKYNFYFYFNPVNNKKKNETERQCCFSDNNCSFIIDNREKKWALTESLQIHAKSWKNYF